METEARPLADKDFASPAGSARSRNTNNDLKQFSLQSISSKLSNHPNQAQDILPSSASSYGTNTQKKSTNYDTGGRLYGNAISISQIQDQRRPVRRNEGADFDQHANTERGPRIHLALRPNEQGVPRREPFR